MRKMITVTLNPSFDRTIWTDGLDFDKVNRVQDEIVQAAGKGVNISRLLSSFGAPNIAIGLAGRANVNTFLSMLKDENVKCDFLAVDGEIRENLTVVSMGKTLKINRMGPVCDRSHLAQLRGILNKYLENFDIIAISGSLPAGLSAKDLTELTECAAVSGGRVALDCEGLNLRLLSQVRPWLVKPNLYELSALLGRLFTSYEDVAAGCDELLAAGVKNVLVTMGEKGLVGASRGLRYKVEVPKVEVRSTVGAGDSALAGYCMAALDNGKDFETALCEAAAMGTAAAMTAATGVPSASLVNSVRHRVVCKEL